MKEFINSSSFFWLGLGIALVILFVGIIMRNIFWPPRGITPRDQIPEAPGKKEWKMLRSRSLWIPIGTLILTALVATALRGTHGTLSHIIESPSFITLWAGVKMCWLWILIALIVGGFVLPKKHTWVLLPIFILLFIVVPFGAWVTTPSIAATQLTMQSSSIPTCDLHSGIPLECWPKPMWPRLVIPPRAKSERILVPVGMRIVMDGNQFLNHTVYRDGKDCAFGGSPCPNGDVVGNDATNESDETNVVSYAFAPIS